ncbi:MAG: hypothetical protein WA885_14110 [Phormidesmis sp.]
MHIKNNSQPVFAGRMLSLVTGVLASVWLGSLPLANPSHAQMTEQALKQVPNANSACYLNSIDGIQYDLSALCPGYEERQEKLAAAAAQAELEATQAATAELERLQREGGSSTPASTPASTSGVVPATLPTLPASVEQLLNRPR